ncbi:single-stranded DNA-binding protein [Rudaeicoccus suwonensis]|uniref:Single-strand DNA-binding protein n=1 Tax=Rudaeicoccus suwonensis TaxID=657409 RepID=A0A561EA33_9MICO|nr:single-stranded DNA-binding protein [Rudaeicoccus suwonensis]TWE12478.1 single-strand DNA-binding protein [Rudaeicoccus suwonensis]
MATKKSFVDGTATPGGAAGSMVADVEGVNDVRLIGRLSAPPQARVLPSGDEVVQLRLVVPRSQKSASRTPRTPSVDTIDVACWSASSRRAAKRLLGTEAIEVEGALRRRFWRAGTAVASRYEVEASSVRLRRPSF